MTIRAFSRNGKTQALGIFILGLINIGSFVSPVWAGDPFRTQNPHNIGDNTESAFLAIFRDGNYKQAQIYLGQAVQTDSQDPLVYAMQASFAYDANDYETMKIYADKTLNAATNLTGKDPLRGNLYLAVGHFLDGGYLLKKGNYLEAVGKASQVFDALDAAAKIDPNDPELNLLRGYLDLFLSRYTPFSQSDQVIARFEKYASPNYLKNRALSTTYRDLKKYDPALAYLDLALAETPNNPEVQYLKGQLLRIQGRENKDLSKLQQAQVYYAQALQKQDQLSRAIVIQLNHENNAVTDEIAKLKANPDLKEF